MIYESVIPPFGTGGRQRHTSVMLVLLAPCLQCIKSISALKIEVTQQVQNIAFCELMCVAWLHNPQGTTILTSEQGGLKDEMQSQNETQMGMTMLGRQRERESEI